MTRHARLVDTSPVRAKLRAARQVAQAADGRTMACNTSVPEDRLEFPMGALKPWHIAVLVVVLILFLVL